jgi:hypothetical protein
MAAAETPCYQLENDKAYYYGAQGAGNFPKINRQLAYELFCNIP